MAPMTFISWIYHFWARFWPYFNFFDFRAYFGHFSHVKKGKYKMPKKHQKMASNQKNERKQFHSKIQFYTGICVTSFDFVRFLLWWSKSTYPSDQGDQPEQDDEGEVSIIIFGMSESSGFQKYSTYAECFRYFVCVFVFALSLSLSLSLYLCPLLIF